MATPRSSKVEEKPPFPSVDLSKPRYDQSKYMGRLKHFWETTSFLNVFASSNKLDNAATLVKQYNKSGTCPPGTTEEQLWKAKRLYDSAFHPVTGEKMFLPGRMSFQVPGNMVLAGMMLTFHRSPYAVTFWQWANQAFNAAVNYTNRSGHDVSMWDVAVPFVAATGAAVGTGVYLNKVVAKHFSSQPLVAKLVPFVAVAAANTINIPLMRYKELQKGNKLVDENDKELGYSKKAARKAIVQTIFTRIAIAAPVLVFPAVIMEQLEKQAIIEQLEKQLKLRANWMRPTLTTVFVGLSLVFAVPVCLAIFPQKSSMSVSRLEPDVQQDILKAHPHMKTVYFNKGL